MSYHSVSSCVTLMWIYGPAASSCLEPCHWPWLRIYAGMSADSLSAWVDIPPDYCLFAQIRQTDLSLQAHFSPLSPASASILSDHPAEVREALPLLWQNQTRLSDKLNNWVWAFFARWVLAHIPFVMHTEMVFPVFSLHISSPVLQEYKRLFADVSNKGSESTPHRWKRNDAKVLGITLVNSRRTGGIWMAYMEMSEIIWLKCLHTHKHIRTSFSIWK